MGVDFLVCDLCSETFCDAGEYLHCAGCDSYIGPCCMDGLSHDESYENVEGCPVCDGTHNNDRVLVYKGKHGLWLLWARSPEEMQAAYEKVFDLLNDNSRYYDEREMTTEERLIYRAAVDRRGKAIERFLEYRANQGYEYESFYFESVETP